MILTWTLLGWLAAATPKALPQREIVIADISKQDTAPSLDGVQMRLGHVYETGTAPSGFITLFLSDSIKALAGSRVYSDFRPSLTLYRFSSFGMGTPVCVNSVTMDSTNAGIATGSHARWAFAHEFVRDTSISTFNGYVRYVFCDSAHCTTPQDTSLTCWSGAACDSLLRTPFCRNTICSKSSYSYGQSWSSSGETILRRLQVPLDSARPYVRWLDTLGTLGNRWEMLLRAWRGGPSKVESFRGTLLSAQGKSLSDAFQPSATLAFTRNPIPNATPTTAPVGTVLYQYSIASGPNSKNSGSPANLLVDTSGHLYAKATISWVDDPKSPRGAPPGPSDTGAHPGWIRAVSKWNFTVGGLPDSVVAVGWVPDPEFSATAARRMDRSRREATGVDALGRWKDRSGRIGDLWTLEPRFPKQ